MNSFGLDLSQCGVFPSQERFEANQVEFGEVVDRLVHEAELVAGECGTQVQFEFVAALDRCLHLGLEDFIAVLARCLGLIQGHICIAQEFSGGFSQAGRDANTGRDHDRHAGLVDLEGLMHDLQDPLGDELGGALQGRFVDQDHELVTAHAPDRVRFPQAGRQPRRHRLQEAITSGVAQRVVDILEPVQIHEQRRARGAVAPVAGLQPLDTVHDQSPIRQARQRVVQGLVTQLITLVLNGPSG